MSHLLRSEKKKRQNVRKRISLIFCAGSFGFVNVKTSFNSISYQEYKRHNWFARIPKHLRSHAINYPNYNTYRRGLLKVSFTRVSPSVLFSALEKPQSADISPGHHSNRESFLFFHVSISPCVRCSFKEKDEIKHAQIEEESHSLFLSSMTATQTYEIDCQVLGSHLFKLMP